jgi:alkanesulfonate monooxygenase SsuD/methylene tetrahydromethanopterin reductase-like flavin-dependent oxidoreductase (luciferase family)
VERFEDHERQLPMFDWVAERRDRVTFGLQAVPRPDDPDPGKRLLTAGHLAEDLGLDAFYVGDHPAVSPECWVHLAALAVITRRIRLGSVVNCALYRHPVMLARLASDLDHLSDGRLVLGLGIGWHVTEFAQLGLPFPPAAERLAAQEEAIEILFGSWGEVPFTYSGRYFKTDAAHVTPSPRQRPRPPLMIAGGGERVTLCQVARFGDACNFGAGEATGGARSTDDVRRKLAVLRGHCEAVGRPYDDILRTHFTSWIFLAETEGEARRKLERSHPQGLTEVQTLTRVVGTPESVAPHYQALADAGIQHFVVQTQDAADTETIRLLATELAPRVRRGEDDRVGVALD